MAALTGTSHPRESANPGPRNRVRTKPGIVQTGSDRLAKSLILARIKNC
jgi:hypothetical protein